MEHVNMCSPFVLSYNPELTLKKKKKKGYNPENSKFSTKIKNKKRSYNRER